MTISELRIMFTYESSNPHSSLMISSRIPSVQTKHPLLLFIINAGTTAETVHYDLYQQYSHVF